jgi:hypothetical protein
VNLTEELNDLVAHEPPYLLDPDAVVAGGARRRRARTTGLVAGLGLTAVVGTAAVLVLQPAAPRDSVTTTNVGSPVAPAPQGRIEAIVRAHTPSTWTFAEVHETSPSDFQANVDDGDGASRLYVGISPSPGTLQQHPCKDPEFAGGGFCKELVLDERTRLIRRGPTPSGPVTSTYVVIVHSDGSGVDVGSDNATWPWVDRLSGPVTPEQKRAMTTPSVNRDLPVYSVDQLVEIAKAVDAAR